MTEMLLIYNKNVQFIRFIKETNKTIGKYHKLVNKATSAMIPIGTASYCLIGVFIL